VNFIFDCGLGFVAYLRGSGNTSVFALEFMYDTLAVAIMFIRLSIQNVRFLLLFFAYIEVFEYLEEVCWVGERSWSFFQALFSNVEAPTTLCGALYWFFFKHPRHNNTWALYLNTSILYFWFQFCMLLCYFILIFLVFIYYVLRRIFRQITKK